MTREQREVHERLITQLPIRTHVKMMVDFKRKKRTTKEVSDLRKKCLALRKKKMKVVEIAKKLNVPLQSVYNCMRTHR